VSDDDAGSHKGASQTRGNAAAKATAGKLSKSGN